MAKFQHLTKLIYDSGDTDSLRLYVFDADGFHRGGQWFRRIPKYPAEEITSAEAKARAEQAIADGYEVRITNDNDFLVFHAMDGEVIHPQDAAEFWKAVL